MKKIIVTGATGAIGIALVKLAIENDYEVLAVVHRSSARAAELDKLEHCRVLKLDLSEYGNALKEMGEQGIPTDGYSMFFHLAWNATYGAEREDYALQAKNVHFAVKAVSFAKAVGCDTFVGAGSQAEYGRTVAKLRPDTPTEPETGYGCAKFCAGNLTRLACVEFGMKHIWDRILSVYGPYDRPESLISTAVSRMSRNEETEFSPCEQIWDYLYSRDAARALLLSGEKGIDGKTYVVGSGKSYPLKWYIEQIARITGYTGELGFGRRPYSEKQVMHLVADITELTKDTGFEPDVAFEEGIREMLRK